MNNFFNLQRFSRLFIRHTAEHYRPYLMSVGVLAGVLLLGGSFLFFVVSEPPDTGLQTAIFVVLLLVSGTIFASTVFSDYGDKRRAIPALTLPATTIEKFLVGWIYSYPVFLLIFSVVFYTALYGLGNAKHWNAGQHFKIFTFPEGSVLTILIIFSLLHAIALYGAVFFRNLHFIRTGFSFLVGYGLILLLNTLLLSMLTGLPVVKAAMPFGYLNFMKGDHYYSIAIRGTPALVVTIVLCVTAILLWIAAYFRLKEKQV